MTREEAIKFAGEKINMVSLADMEQAVGNFLNSFRDPTPPEPAPNSRYIAGGLEPGKERRITVLAQALRPLKFDAIAFQGVSGALVAPVIGFILRKPLIAVRKGEKSHTTRKVEFGIATPKTYVIVDDFISTGETIKQIVLNIAAYYPESKCVGIGLWSDHAVYDTLGPIVSRTHRIGQSGEDPPMFCYEVPVWSVPQ